MSRMAIDMWTGYEEKKIENDSTKSMWIILSQRNCYWLILNMSSKWLHQNISIIEMVFTIECWNTEDYVWYSTAMI